ncbi:MAG: hypothetical protein BIFFINMI_00746 [Phycisphaerae bacterium]|nr:hypothetical protein [Phycisphaerae bacterium]
MNTFGRIAAVVAIALCLAGPRLLAEDVQVKIVGQPDPQVNPDAPPQTPPAPTTPEGPKPATGDKAFKTGDYGLDFAMPRLNLTEEQKAKFAPLLEKFAADAAKAQAEFQAQGKDLFTRMEEARKKGDEQTRQELMKQWRELGARHYASSAETRKALLTAMIDSGMLSAVQAEELRMMIEETSGSLAGRAMTMARSTLMMQTRGLQLDDALRQRMIKALTPRYETELRKQAEINEKTQPLYDQLRAVYEKKDKEKMDQLYAEIRKLSQPMDWATIYRESAKEIVDMLPPEQQATLKELRHQESAKAADQYVNYAVTPYGKLKLTEEQSRKLNELSDAARQAMADLDLMDYAGRSELTGQLQRDLWQTLTPEQQKELGKAAGYYYRGRRGTQPAEKGTDRGDSAPAPKGP